MGLCYSLRPRLFGEPGGSTSDSDQPPDPSVPLRDGALDNEDSGGRGENVTSSDQISRGDPSKPSAGDVRGNTSTGGMLIQNGGGGDCNRGLQLLQEHSSQRQKNLKNEKKEAAREAKKVSKNIDHFLNELKQEYEQTHRLLLLG